MNRISVSIAWPALFAALLFSTPAQGAIWPDQIATFTRKSAAAEVASHPALWEEFGLQEAESAVYEDPSTRATFRASAYRLADPTAAYAAFFWQRPASASPVPGSELAVTIPGGLLVAFGNYLMKFQGYTPQLEELPNIVGFFPRLQTSTLPALDGYLPRQDRVSGSERYILGPVSLREFERRIPAAAAAFHLGAEGQSVRYQTPEGEFTLTLFSYPTPNLARQQLEELQKLEGALAKRSGPLVAVLFAPANSERAQKLLSAIRYQAEISWSEYVPTQKDNIGDLVVNAFVLIGLLLGFFILSGVAFGGLRLLRARLFRGSGGDDTPITLHLEDR